MNNTDEELREQIADIFDDLSEPTNPYWHRDSGLSWADKVMPLISTHKARWEREAREKAYVDAIKQIERLMRIELERSSNDPRTV